MKHLLRHWPVVPVLAAIALLAALPRDADAQKKKRAARHEEMDYGPFLTATIKAPVPAKNTANKGLALKLDGAAVCFDLDLVRFSCGWTGDFLTLRGTPYDGSHGPSPEVKGKPAFATTPTPGWARPGTTDFKDPRDEPYGPLPASWARYRGLYLSEAGPVLHYTVGECKVLDAPSFADGVFTRVLNLGPTGAALTHLVAFEEKAKGRVEAGNLAVLEKGDQLVVAGVNGAAGATWKVEDGKALLTLPASKEAVRCALVVARIAKDQLATFRDAVNKARPADLTPRTKGGPTRWKETVTTKGTLGTGTGAYVLDTITVPENNPYKSWMRFGGVDFFSDGRAAVSTWSGDVWVVSGIDDKLDKVTWKRFATGLFQPLGLKIVDDRVHVLGREGIVRLHDLNGNGEADHYEAFNNDVATTPGFHEFAFDLHTDAEGNFYYAKGGPVRGGGSGFEYIAKHSGCLLKVSRDGSKHEVFATGFRAPNGIGVGPKGEVTSGDNEGTWMPMCRLSLVLPGSFNGCVDTAHRPTPPTDYDPPICWMPKNVDNSSGGQVWVTSKKMGPLEGQLLHMSYGQSSLYHVLMEGDGKNVQGGLVKIPLPFQSGISRARIHPKDGQLYVAGLRGWQTNAPRDACLQRVRYTGKPYSSVVGLKVIKDGLELTFSQKMDPKTAADAENYAAQQWNYLWSSNYGSAEYKPIAGFDEKVKRFNELRKSRGKNAAELQKLTKELERGRERVEIKAAKLSEDGRTVTLSIPGLKPVMQMNLKYRVKTASGESLNQDVYNTINRVP